MSKKILWLVVVIIVVFFGFRLFSGGDPTSEEADVSSQESETVGEEATVDKEENIMEEEGDGAIMKENIITYTDSGFSPSSLTIEVGDTVTFKNNSSRLNWPATAVHPTHRVYPGSDIKKCNSAAEGAMFDACGAVASGGEWQFTFGETGSWGYHDHLRISNTGRIIVK